MHAIRIRTWGLLVALILVSAACSSDSSPSNDAAPKATDPPVDEVPAIDPAIAALPGAEGVTANPDGTDPLPAIADDIALPIVFAHGFAGSAQQYESQAMRFAANGYPQDRIVAYDHDGAGFDIEGYVVGLDDVVDQALAEFGVDQVYLVGHSRGTAVSSTYLADPARAAKVAKYVAIDGSPCVDVVPCIAPNQAGHPGQSHVEVATSPESFAEQFEFLVGTPPEVTDIVPQKDPVVISGRAVNFPANTGRTNATLDVFEVDPATGMRLDAEPNASFELDADGSFGPLALQGGSHYEYALSTPDTPVVHHLYLQPYVRDSGLVRLLSSDPDGATRTNTNVGDDHTALVIIRMREWYGLDDPDDTGDERDVLDITTGDGETVNAVTDFVKNSGIGLHIHDDAATPGQSTLAPLPYFSTQPFQSGIDVFMPASDPPDAAITITNLPRGDADRPQTVNVPNWASSNHAVSVIYMDYPVD